VGRGPGEPLDAGALEADVGQAPVAEARQPAADVELVELGRQVRGQAV